MGSNPQIDDLFLATEEPFVTTNSYRMTAADSQALAPFAANVPALPAGSSFRVRASPFVPRNIHTRGAHGSQALESDRPTHSYCCFAAGRAHCQLHTPAARRARQSSVHVTSARSQVCFWLHI
jgi:hypothetical protein